MPINNHLQNFNPTSFGEYQKKITTAEFCEPYVKTSNVSPITAEMFSKQFFKTRLCPYNLEGFCRRGSSCTYAHSVEELHLAPDLYKTKLCPTWRKGFCNDTDCRFAHGWKELRSTNQFYKTRVCHFWLTGGCNKGKACRHAHGTGQVSFHENQFWDSATQSFACSSDYWDETTTTTSSTKSYEQHYCCKKAKDQLISQEKQPYRNITPLNIQNNQSNNNNNNNNNHTTNNNNNNNNNNNFNDNNNNILSDDRALKQVLNILFNENLQTEFDTNKKNSQNNKANYLQHKLNPMITNVKCCDTLTNKHNDKDAFDLVAAQLLQTISNVDQNSKTYF